MIARFGAGVLWAGCFVGGTLVAAGHLLLGRARRRQKERYRAA